MHYFIRCGAGVAHNYINKKYWMAMEEILMSSLRPTF